MLRFWVIKLRVLKVAGLKVAGWNADEADGFAKADGADFFLWR